MITVIFIIALIGAIVIWYYFVDDLDSVLGTIGIVVGALAFAAFLCGVICLHDLLDSRSAEENILQYEEENRAIEASIESLVNSYLELKETNGNELKGEDAINMASILPEIKTSERVEEMLTKYDENKEEIKRLRTILETVPEYKWLLYFGK